MCLAARPLALIHSASQQRCPKSQTFILPPPPALRKEASQCRWKPEVGSAAPLWTCAHVDNVHGVSVNGSINQPRLMKAQLRSSTAPALMIIFLCGAPRAVETFKAELCDRIKKKKTLWHYECQSGSSATQFIDETAGSEVKANMATTKPKLTRYHAYSKVNLEDHLIKLCHWWVQ